MERSNKAGTARNEKVVNCLYQNPDAIFRLICFPWAGGGSNYFAKWGQKIHNSLEVHSIRLAGRESRSKEPFASDIHQVVDEIACALLPVLEDKPFAFLGHSMGSYTAFMTALHLKQKHKQEPVHFFVSSVTPPHGTMARMVWAHEKTLKSLSTPSSRLFPEISFNHFLVSAYNVPAISEPILTLKALPHIPEEVECTEERIRCVLKGFGGTPKDFIDDKELWQAYTPRLMADARIFRNYTFDRPSEALLSCDLTCFRGSEDIVKDMEAWKDVTSGSVDIHVLPGDHFYLMEPSNETFIRNYIAKCLELTMLSSF